MSAASRGDGPGPHAERSRRAEHPPCGMGRRAASDYHGRGGRSPRSDALDGVGSDAVNDKDQDVQALEPMADAPPHPDGRATAPHTPPIGELLERFGDRRRAGAGRPARGGAPRRDTARISWPRRLRSRGGGGSSGSSSEPVIGILIVAAVIAGAMGEWVDTLAILAIVAPERPARLLPGGAGRAGPGRPAEALGPAGQGPPRRASCRRCRPASWCPATAIELEAGRPHPGRRPAPPRVRLPRPGGRPHRRVGPRGQGRRAASWTRARRWATGGTWPTWARSSPPARPAPWSSPPAWTPSWARSPACSSGTEPEPTPLQRRLAELGKVLVVVCLAVVAVIFVLQLLRGDDLARGLPAVGEPGGGRRARGAAGRGHRGAGPGPAADGRAQRPDPQAAQRRDARLGDRHLLRQDRHADPQRDDRPRGRGRRPIATRSPGPATTPAGSFHPRAEAEADRASATADRPADRAGPAAGPDDRRLVQQRAGRRPASDGRRRGRSSATRPKGRCSSPR